MSCTSSFSLMSSKAKPSTLLTERTSVLLPCPAAGARASCARRAHSTNVRSTPDQQQVERPLEIWHPQQPLGIWRCRILTGADMPHNVILRGACVRTYQPVLWQFPVINGNVPKTVSIQFWFVS